jgi:hypothetical protein
MNPRPYPDSSASSTGRRARRRLPGPRAVCGWTLLLLLLTLGGARAAHATTIISSSTTIDYTINDDVDVQGDGTVVTLTDSG